MQLECCEIPFAPRQRVLGVPRGLEFNDSRYGSLPSLEGKPAKSSGEEAWSNDSSLRASPGEGRIAPTQTVYQEKGKT